MWVLSLLVEFWSWYNKISLCYAASSFTYRRAEIQWHYNRYFYQVLNSTTFINDESPRLGATQPYAGHYRVSSPVLSSLCWKLSPAPHWTPVVSSLCLERSGSCWCAVALKHGPNLWHFVTIWRMLECLYLLTFPAESLPPEYKGINYSKRETWWLQGQEMRACNLEFPSQLIMLTLQLLKVTRLHFLRECLLLIKENVCAFRTQE